MYDNILNKPLQLKPNISNAARHLLEGLLQKDRTKRLGCTDDFVSVCVCVCVAHVMKYLCHHRIVFSNATLPRRELDSLLLFAFQTEIKNHMFFSPINWEELNAKKLTPPFNPNVVRSPKPTVGQRGCC